MLRGGEGRGAIILRTYAGGGGGSMESVQVRTRGEGGVRKWRFYCVRTLRMPPYFSLFSRKTN